MGIWRAAVDAHRGRPRCLAAAKDRERSQKPSTDSYGCRFGLQIRGVTGEPLLRDFCADLTPGSRLFSENQGGLRLVYREIRAPGTKQVVRRCLCEGGNTKM